MTVAQFPTRFNSDYPTEPISQDHLILVDRDPEFPALYVKPMKGGGASYSLQSNKVILRWDFTYNGLLPDEAAVLDDHRMLAQDQFGAFSFRHPRTGYKYENVHYESFENPGHEHINCQSRHVVLVCRVRLTDLGAILGENGDFMLSQTGFHILQQN